MSADTEAIALTKCPDCGAVVGDPCVYLTPKDYDDLKSRRGWMRRQGVADRAGTPMKRVHQGRYHDAQRVRTRAARKAVREQYLPRPMSSVLRQKGALDPDRYPEPLATYLTAVAFDHHGYTRLREWLTENAEIFR